MLGSTKKESCVGRISGLTGSEKTRISWASRGGLLNSLLRVYVSTGQCPSANRGTRAIQYNQPQLASSCDLRYGTAATRNRRRDWAAQDPSWRPFFFPCVGATFRIRAVRMMTTAPHEEPLFATSSLLELRPRVVFKFYDLPQVLPSSA